MKKTLYLTLVLVALLLLTVKLLTLPLANFFIPQAQAGLQITSVPDGAEVYIDSELKGKTPHEEASLKKAEVYIKLISKGGIWGGKVTLNPGTWTVVKRNLSADPQTQAGEILTLEKGEGVNVISSPDGASVEIDGKGVGQTPLKLSLEKGEYNFVIKKGNYLPSTVKATIPEDFNLTLNVDLALTEADLSSISLPAQSTTPKVKVLSTPTNFLRVRDQPSLSGKEITRVEPNDELLFLGEESNWYKVRLKNGMEGFILASYAEKITQ